MEYKEILAFVGIVNVACRKIEKMLSSTSNLLYFDNKDNIFSGKVMIFIGVLGKQKEYYGKIKAIPFQEALQDLPQLIS